MVSIEVSNQAELDLCGCLLVEPEETLRKVSGIVSADDFRNISVKAIYCAASALVYSDQACDPTLILATAEKRGISIDTQFCKDCMQKFLTTANAAETARIIHDAAIQRAAEEIGLSLSYGAVTAVEGLAKLQELVRGQGSRIHTPMEAANSVMDYISSAASGKTKPFLKTGYSRLDDKLSGGLANGGLITVAARPGTGKTTVGVCIAENVAAAGGAVLYISLEMTEEQIWSCRAARLSKINRSSIQSGVLNDYDWPKLLNAFEELSRRPFYVRDKPTTIEEIEREARCINNLALVVVDHVGLITATERGNRYEVMTDTAHRLKQLALSLKVPFLALCQLNRASVQRDTKRPNMADLRDSGAIEEDSDVVCLLFRSAQYLPQNEQLKPWEDQEIDFIIDKNRHGITGIVTLLYNGSLSVIKDR